MQPATSSRAPQDLSPRGFDAVANIVMHGTFYVTHAVASAGLPASTHGSVVSIVVTWLQERRALRGAVGDEQGRPSTP